MSKKTHPTDPSSTHAAMRKGTTQPIVNEPAKVQWKPGFSLRSLGPVLATLRRHGVEPLGFIDGLGLSTPADLDVRLSAATFARFWERITRRVSPTIGLEAASSLSEAFFEWVPFSGSNPLLTVLTTSRTLQEGLRRLARCLPSLYPGYQLSLHWEEGSLQAILRSPDHDDHAGPSFIEYVLGLISTSARYCGRSQILPESVSLSHQATSDLSAYDATFAAPITWGASENALRFASNDAIVALRTASPQLATQIERQLTEGQPQGTQPQSIETLVATTVRLCLASGRPTMQRVARELQLSTRTLTRRLTQANVSFSTIVDAELSAVAKHLLQTRLDLTLDEIAVAMHYADVRAFSRACKRWFEAPPGVLRRAAQEALQAARIEVVGLPQIRSELIGRQQALSVLTHLLSKHRLVTVHGTGGIGKTRLVIGYASQASGRHRGGVYFCDLSTAREAADIDLAMATLLGLQLGRDDPAKRVEQALARLEHVLLILDNLEQLVTAGSARISTWLAASPSLRVLVTSREPLRLAGEEVMVIEPLEVPTQEDLEHGPRDVIEARASVTLFLRRAGEAHVEDVWSEEDIRAIGALVRTLDGLPLAIELAASRVQYLTPEQMLERMTRRFDLLRRRRSQGVTRHDTLRATIQWSWDLLAPWEQAALAQCSVFLGGFTLDAAEAVVDLQAWPQAPWTVDVLIDLVDKSLLRSPTPDDKRYHFYDSIRAFARDQLDPSGPVHKRHLDHVSQLGTMAMLARVERGDATLHTLLQEQGNLRVAFDFAMDNRHDVALDAMARSALALALIGLRRGPFATTRQWLKAVLTHTALAQVWCARLHHALADLYAFSADFSAAIDHYNAALAIDLPDVAATHGHCLKSLGAIFLLRGDVERSRETLERGLALAQRSGHWDVEARLRREFGVWSHNQGHLDDALRHYESALAIARSVGHREIEAWCLNDIGVVHHVRDELDAALRAYQACDALSLRLELRTLRARCCNNLGSIFQIRGALDEAQSWREEGLMIARALGDRATETRCLNELGALHEQRGDLNQARTLYTSAAYLAERVGYGSGQARALLHLTALAMLRGDFPEASDQLAQARARSSTLADQGVQAKGLLNSGRLALAQGDHERARHDLDAALHVAKANGYRRLVAESQRTLGALDRLNGRLECAEQHLTAALVFAQDIGDRRFEGDVQTERAACALTRGALDQAIIDIDAADAALTDAAEVPLRVAMLGVRASIKKAQGHPTDAAASRAEAHALIARMSLDERSPLTQCLDST